MNENIIYNQDILDYIFNFISLWSIGQYGILSVCKNFRNTIKNKKFIPKTVLKYKNIEQYITIYSKQINIINDYNATLFSKNYYHPLCIDCNILYIKHNNRIQSLTTIYKNKEPFIKISQRKVINNSLVKIDPIIYYNYYIIIPKTVKLLPNKSFYNIADTIDIVHQEYITRYLTNKTELIIK